MSTPAAHFDHVLMCAPTAYALKYEINPWMSLQNTPDIPAAERQWELLYRTLTEQIGVPVELVPQSADAPDMVFTANAGLVKDDLCLLSHFHHPERQVEEPHFRRWFEEHGYHVAAPPADVYFEGEGDALFAGDRLLAGYMKRSDISSHRWCAEMLGIEVLSLELTDSRWYHLDTCLFPLTADTVLFYPGAFDSYACDVIRSHYQTIEICEADALKFACNSVRFGNHIVMPSGCPETTARLEALGYTVWPVELGEFLKAGGAAKCLTLQLNRSSL
jgi:N-dimethylarginine dimethylaminohydrolase